MKPKQVVDDDLYRAADVVSADGAEHETFGEDALTGEGRVAVDDDRKYIVATVFALARLLGSSATQGDGVDGLEVAWVRDEVERNGPAVRTAELAGCAHVVLHVAAAHRAARIDILELGEQLARRDARWCWSSR